MTAPRHWKPLKELSAADFEPENPKVVAVAAKHYGIPEEEARQMLGDYRARCRYFVNDIYQVYMEPYGPGCLHLNIRRRDGGMIKDWRHFQAIKNQLAGPEREAIELYPAESRVVDTSNKWHLWVLPEGERMDCGWPERDVSYAENRDVPGLRQRPL